ncbi:dihydropteroate synthase [Patescibacteria group bacterium]|nr:dihydropteroate synthase [Patescibacteria group bacterium]
MDFSKPQIMGVVNATPDSFSDGGDFYNIEDAKSQIQSLIKQGADIIDIGGESTGPGSSDVSLKVEMNRVAPIVDYIAENKLTEKALFSIDTYKAPVARYALEHGFQIVNDVTALRGDPDMIDVLVEYEPYIILMYSKDATPRTTSEKIEYDDVIASIKTFLIGRIVELVDAGFPEDNIIIDPGMGMFVSADPKYSFEIIERLLELKQLSYPICIGVSRKSFLGGKLEDREKPSVEYSLKALKNGASIIRTHNVNKLKESI